MQTGNTSTYGNKSVSLTNSTSSQDLKSLRKKNLIEEMSKEAYDYISQTVPIYSDKVHLVESYKPDDYYQLSSPILGVVDVCPINFSDDINKYLYELNNRIPEATIFVGCCIAKDVPNSNKSYKNKTIKRSKKNLLYKAEALGRIVYSGFSIIEFKEIDNLVYFMVMKVKSAPNNLVGCSTSLLFSTMRIGKEGKKLKIFKFRTMHPYSQYLQDYVVRLNGYNELGKPADDFRLTPQGKLFRKYWIDELPQIINFIRGELTLFGVRPLSPTRFSELPREVQEMRIKYKPGCIPPYVALNMPDSEGNIKAEWIYMNERQEKGFRTDIKYLFLALKNIFTGQITSS